MKHSIMKGKECPYCGSVTAFVDSSVIYGKSYGMIYLCKPCDAYVGVHKGSTIALGRLANYELREAKKRAHLSFDPLWKNGMFKSRRAAYSWLAKEMNLSEHMTHIGMFNVEQCNQVVNLCKERLA